MAHYPSSKQEESEDYRFSVEGPSGPFTDFQHRFGDFYSHNHYDIPSASSAANVHTGHSYPFQDDVDDPQIASLPHPSLGPLSTPNGSTSGGDTLTTSMGGLYLDPSHPLTQSSYTSHSNLPRLQVPQLPLPHSFPSATHSDHSFLASYNGTSPYHSPSSPDPSYLSADSGPWPPHPDRTRPRSHSASGSFAPYSLSRRSRSPSVSDHASEDSYFSDGSSVFSEEASTREHIDPQLLSNHTFGGESSSGYSSYSNESSSPHPSDLEQPAGSSAGGRERRVASVKTRNASQKRRKKDARFYCSVPGCGGSFTARHNLLNHENSHNGVRNYVCESCNIAFVTSAVLKRHKRSCKGRA